MTHEMTLAEYKARVDAKYAAVRKHQEQYAREQKARRRKDHWLLVGPNGEIDGVMTKRFCGSAAQAFEEFFPKKRDRHRASAEGWHIEEDDAEGSRWAAACEEHRQMEEANRG
ncbi:hypothetical protein LZP97_27075 (plasmid) [Rhodococcus sp. DMF-1]|uniref:hypothetical protein n=1 Tax=Rhodococcus TaxID=1827 RepID=UPI00065FC30C|nr:MULTISPECIES: hypothetical protein [Rhodococcus]UIR36923.1 hypothetical protein LZP97_25655 [Rhodococcus sp. DMF-1]UIR39750.1 hypothetical protein LZP97_27075 [Rhodococcus sp. DMF-1]